MIGETSQATAWWFQVKKILQLATPIFVSQITIVLYGIVDTVMVGRLSVEGLAVLGLVNAIYLTVYVTATSVIQALTPVIAQHQGAGQFLRIREEMIQGAWLAWLVGIPAFFALYFPDWFLKFAKVDDQLYETAKQYLKIQAFIIPASTLFRVYISFHQAIARPLAVTILHFMGLCVKIILNQIFVVGAFGFVGLGVIGCAVSNILILWVFVIVCFAHLFFDKSYHPYQFHQIRYLPKSVLRPHLATLLAQLRLGVPIGVNAFLDVGGFTIMTAMITPLGVVALGSHQIMNNLALLCFMIPLSVSISVQALLGQAIGTKNKVAIKQLITVGYGITVGLALLTSLSLWLGRDWVLQQYHPAASVKMVALSVIGFMCCYHWFDAFQIIGSFILRSFKVVTQPMVVYIVAMWGVGIPMAYLLIKNPLAWSWLPAFNPAGVWVGTALGQGLAGVGFVMILTQRLLRKPS